MTQMQRIALPSETAPAAGLPVVMLHGSGMDSGSWEGLIGCIGPRFTSIPLDRHGHAREPDASAAPPRSLDEIAADIGARIDGIGRPVHIVAHDFGAVIALRLAASRPGSVASLTLIEPTAYNAVVPETEEAWQIPRDVTATATRMRTLLDEGDAWTAMAQFVDFTNGPGTWERTSMGHRQTLARQAAQTAADLRAISADILSADELAGVVCPVLMVRGADSRWTLQQVARDLAGALPFLQERIIDGAGHFPHLSDPHRVDPMIVDFLVRVDGQWQDTSIALQRAA